MESWNEGDEGSMDGFPYQLTFENDSEEEDDVFEPISYEITFPSQFGNTNLRVFKEVDRTIPPPTGCRSYIVPTAGAIQTDHQLADILHKTILVGDSGVGKTSLLVQFNTGQFHASSFAATVGIGFTNKTLKVDGSEVKLQIWDTAGQERFRSVTHAYYRDAHALLLLYDVTNRKSFYNTRAWLAEINEYAHRDIIVMLIGNKFDCTGRVVGEEEGVHLAKEYRVSFMETSAKTGLNVDQAFIEVARALKEKKASVSDTIYEVKEYIEPKERETSENSSCSACNTT